MVTWWCTSESLYMATDDASFSTSGHLASAERAVILALNGCWAVSVFSKNRPRHDVYEYGWNDAQAAAWVEHGVHG